MDGIKIYRAKHSITQSELADALHVRRSTVAIWETKSKRLVQKLRRAFSCQILYGRLRFLRLCATMLSVENRVRRDKGLRLPVLWRWPRLRLRIWRTPTVMAVFEIAFFNFLVKRNRYDRRAFMKALTYLERGRFAVTEKPKPVVTDPRDAVVRVTLGSICTSDLHIKHGSVPRAVPGITVGHEMVGVVEAVGAEVKTVRPGDRVTVNVETFCGECYFCRHGWVNNCTDPDGGWALGCRIDGGQTEFVRVPYADQGLDKIPDGVTDEQALFVGDILATGF